MGKTKIEWATDVWNPIRGCSRVSEGCRNCYAERVAARFSGPGQPYEGLAHVVRIKSSLRPDVEFAEARWTGVVRVVKEHLEDPLHWTKPRMIFVNSMSDLFHELLPEEDIVRVIDVMIMSLRKTDHIFQVLTKRPERMRVILGKINPIHIDPRIWWGVSVEDQKTADERIPILLETPAAVRWVSYEPALGPVDFCNLRKAEHGEGWLDALTGLNVSGFNAEGCLDWVVVGGESGPGARRMSVEWSMTAMQQCKAAGVPFFMKQGSQENWADFKNIDSFPKELQVREYPKIDGGLYG